MRVVLAGVLSSLFILSHGYLSCNPLSPVTTAAWCNDNCNNNPSYCPDTLCACAVGIAPSVSPVPSSAGVSCTPVSNLATTTWCNAVCNNNPPNCPSQMCSCVVGPIPSPSPAASKANLVCVAVRIPATDFWCTVNCNAGYCPNDTCSCAPGAISINSNASTGSYVALSACGPVFTNSWCNAVCPSAPTSSPCQLCCKLSTAVLNTPIVLTKAETQPTPLDNTMLYYSLPNSIGYISVNGFTGAVNSQGTCASGFISAQGIAVDSNQGVFVADFGASQLLYIQPVCKNATVVIPRGHFISSPLEVEILNQYGTLLVSSGGAPGIYQVSIDSNYQIVQYDNTGATNDKATGLAECYDTFGNNGFLFVEQGYFLYFYDLVKKTKTLIVNADLGVVDIADVEYRPGCGIFFIAQDDHQVYQCGVNLNNTKPTVWNSCAPPLNSCVRVCNNLVDSSSCANLVSPSGLTLDCSCNNYVSNLGNGKLVGYVAYGPEIVFDNKEFAYDVDMFGPNFCQPPIISPTRSPTRSPSPSVTPTPPGSATPSPSRSPSVSPSPSSSPSPSISPTPSRSPSQSPSPSASWPFSLNGIISFSSLNCVSPACAQGYALYTTVVNVFPQLTRTIDGVSFTTTDCTTNFVIGGCWPTIFATAAQAAGLACRTYQSPYVGSASGGQCSWALDATAISGAATTSFDVYTRNIFTPAVYFYVNATNGVNGVPTVTSQTPGSNTNLPTTYIQFIVSCFEHYKAGDLAQYRIVWKFPSGVPPCLNIGWTQPVCVGPALASATVAASYVDTSNVLLNTVPAYVSSPPQTCSCENC